MSRFLPRRRPLTSVLQDLAWAASAALAINLVAAIILFGSGV